MRRIARLVIVLSVLAAVAAPAAVAAERMWVGFHDDPSFRWVGNRKERVQGASQTNATIMRLLVQWNIVAKSRPSNPSSPFDPAYNFDDIDEAVRAAQENDQEVVLTLSGTPRWANGGKSPNIMPRRVADFTSFARAIASRYSGRFEGYPFVRFYSVWNEPNLQLFLAPQFNGRGKSVAPANYAKLAAAAYTGIKAGSRQALVAVGETSARGSDKPTGLRPTHTPGKFAELVAKANPRLRFDAWSHHPYPFNPNSPPTQRVRWPNVSLALLPRFDTELKRWFKRKSVPIWITEYGHQTRPEDSLGIPYAKQAAYIQQSMSMVSRYSFVPMFIWFVYQDDQGQPWESGIYTRNGNPKGQSPARFTTTARPLDARNGVVVVRRGTLTPLITVHTRRYCANSSSGTPVGMTWRVFRGGRLIDVDQQTAPLRNDCTIAARIRVRGGVARRQTYMVTFELNNASGVVLNRRITLRAAS
ncbi:MAG TPA: cellulase family glycosylhydrolase [Gaiellaceae bacterium]|nr:cellulase family glycosylhydrolase [Gaiellaceae bacterium]